MRTDDLNPGDLLTVSRGRRSDQYRVKDDGERIKLERIPTKAEVVKALGYDPARLAFVMGCYWK